MKSTVKNVLWAFGTTALIALAYGCERAPVANNLSPATANSVNASNVEAANVQAKAPAPSALTPEGIPRYLARPSEQSLESASSPPAQRRPPTPEEEAKMEAEMNALYKKLDAKIGKQADATAWTPPAELKTTIAAAAPAAKIEMTGCGADFCRYSVALSKKEAVEEFTKNFSVEGSILYRYSQAKPLSVIAYVFRPNADLRSL